MAERKIMKKARKCINCKHFEPKKADSYIGICRVYNKCVKDTLCGCERDVKNGVIVLKNFN